MKKTKKTSQLVPEVYVSKPMKLDMTGLKGKRVDLEFSGIDHSGPSYEGRVFVNNPKADQKTIKTIRSGYVGSIYVFGHGGCFGSLGHCDIHEHTRPYDLRNSHPLTKISKRLIVTDKLVQLGPGTREIRVTIVPVISKGVKKWTTADVDMRKVIQLEKISINVYS